MTMIIKRKALHFELSCKHVAEEGVPSDWTNLSKAAARFSDSEGVMIELALEIAARCVGVLA